MKRRPRATPKRDYSAELVFQIRALGLPLPTREYRFHHTRQWRFDLAWPELKIAFEIEGGVFSRTQGRHCRGAGFREDCIKYNNAALLGWRVFRVLTDNVKDGSAVVLVEQALLTTRLDNS